MEELLAKEGIKVKNNKVLDFDQIFWDPSKELLQLLVSGNPYFWLNRKSYVLTSFKAHPADERICYNKYGPEGQRT